MRSQGVPSRLGQAEIRHPDRAACIEQQIRRFDVPVQHALPMGIAQGIRYLEADPGDAATETLVGPGDVG